jgi:hypothetical protein
VRVLLTGAGQQILARLGTLHRVGLGRTKHHGGRPACPDLDFSSGWQVRA